MTAELAEAFLRANLLGGGAVLLVLLLRAPARRALGAETAYGLWAAPPAAVLLSLLPWPFQTPLGTAAPQLTASGDLLPPLLAVWLAGAALRTSWLIAGQARFERAARAGLAGPAVVGVFCPRVVMPRGLYTLDEQRLIRAHEREHVRRGDPRANAAAVLLSVLFWCNPLAHLALRRLRIDQELACDAATVRRLPCERRRYAETLLKTQTAKTPLPLGCRWPAGGRHPLQMRIAALHTPVAGSVPGRLAVGVFVLAVSAAVLAVQPPLAMEPQAWPTPPRVILVDITPAGAG